MTNDIDMQRKMAEIGARYLARTTAELGDLQRMVTELPTGGNATLKEIEILAHRIRGSGAVFGFAQLSDIAGVIEMLAVDSALIDLRSKMRNDAQLAEQFAVHLQQLVAETQAAAAAHKS
jgi:HPt (histidine-containing phosphotransfer) domain-containing protein